MSAAAVSKRHSPDPASEDSVDARTTRPHRKPLAAQSPRQRPERSCLAPRTAQYRAPQGLKWLSFTPDSGLIHGSSADLGKYLGRFRMAAMGRSFHWMDRDATLVALDELIEPNGAVAVLGEHHTNAPENSFKPIWDAIIKKWAPEAFEAREVRQRPDWESHETILRRSPVSRCEGLASVSRRETSIEELIGRSHSQSVSSLAALGDNVAAFERELRESLSRISPTGKLKEVVEADALIARRAL